MQLNQFKRTNFLILEVSRPHPSYSGGLEVINHMLNLRNSIIAFLILAQATGCTTAHNVYTGDEDLAYDEEFSVLNTILLPIGIAGAVLVIVGLAYGGGSGSTYQSTPTISCRGSYCNYQAAWDYLPGSSQYRCRDTNNGQFVYDSYCYGQYKQDNWY